MAWLALGAIASAVTVIWVGWIILGTLIRKPRIRLECHKEDGLNGKKILECAIINDPIYFGPLVHLGIKRSGFDEVWCLMSVGQLGKRETIIDRCAAALHDNKGGHHESAPLPASPFGLTFPVAVMEDGLAIAYDSAGVGHVLEPDTYACVLLVHADEIHVKPYANEFVVGVDEEHFHWAGQWRMLSRSFLRRLVDKLANWRAR